MLPVHKAASTGRSQRKGRENVTGRKCNTKRVLGTNFSSYPKQSSSDGVLTYWSPSEKRKTGIEILTQTNRVRNEGFYQKSKEF